MIRLIENKIFFKAQHMNVTLLFDNHIIMTYNDNESDLSEVFIIVSISFIIVVRITTFSHHFAK